MTASETRIDKNVAVSDINTRKLISKRRRVSLPQWATAWLVLIPAMICIVAFMFFPIINTFLNAFLQQYFNNEGGNFALGQFLTAVSLGDPTTFGINNFIEVLTEESGEFVQSILNTALLTIVEVPLTIIVSLLIATFLNNIKVLKGFYQTIFFLPYVTNTIALGLIFTVAFGKNEGGLVNLVLKNVFGADPVNWLDYRANEAGVFANRWTEFVVIVFYSLWNGIAFKILVFMAGLATIDSQYYNAAKIDGANNFTIWRRITLPLLSPQILYITITSFIGSFKMYTGVMTVFQGVNADPYYFGGSPDTGTDWITVVGYIYRNVANAVSTPGKASAASIILLGIIMVITAIQFLVSKTRVHY